jgi:hypothetical protein
VFAPRVTSSPSRGYTDSAYVTRRAFASDWQRARSDARFAKHVLATARAAASAAALERGTAAQPAAAAGESRDAAPADGCSSGPLSGPVSASVSAEHVDALLDAVGEALWFEWGLICAAFRHYAALSLHSRARARRASLAATAGARPLGPRAAGGRGATVSPNAMAIDMRSFLRLAIQDLGVTGQFDKGGAGARGVLNAQVADSSQLAGRSLRDSLRGSVMQASPPLHTAAAPAAHAAAIATGGRLHAGVHGPLAERAQPTPAAAPGAVDPLPAAPAAAAGAADACPQQAPLRAVSRAECYAAFLATAVPLPTPATGGPSSFETTMPSASGLEAATASWHAHEHSSDANADAVGVEDEEEDDSSRGGEEGTEAEAAFFEACSNGSHLVLTRARFLIVRARPRHPPKVSATSHYPLLTLELSFACSPSRDVRALAYCVAVPPCIGATLTLASARLPTARASATGCQPASAHRLPSCGVGLSPLSRCPPLSPPNPLSHARVRHPVCPPERS